MRHCCIDLFPSTVRVLKRKQLFVRVLGQVALFSFEIHEQISLIIGCGNVCLPVVFSIRGLCPLLSDFTVFERGSGFGIENY